MTTDNPAVRVRIYALGGFRLLVDGRELRLRTRKEATLLLRLALAGADGLTRDECVALLWPESSEARARHSLSEALRGIEQATRLEIVRTPERVAITGDDLATDVAELDDAMRRGDVDACVSLYRGGFLAGWYPPTPEASHWLDATGAAIGARLEKATRAQLVARRQSTDSRGVSACVALLDTLGVATDGDREAAAEAEQITGWESLRPGESIQPRIPIDREGPFVGRVEEMKLLTAELDRALAGELRVVLVSGEAGIGKTRTCQRLARLAALRGARLFMSKCYELEQSVPFGALEEAFGGSVRPSDVAEMRPLWRRVLAEVMPQLAEFHVGQPSDPESDLRTMQTRILQSSVALVEAVARERPGLLLVDDFHWADTATCQVLNYLARRARPKKGLLILLTFRGHELELNPAAAALVRSVSADRISLRPLNATDTRKQIHGLIGETDRRRVERIMRRSGGNPFFARQLALAEHSTEDITPASIREVVLAQVESFAPILQRIVGLIAVAGGRIHVDALASAMEIDSGDLLGPIAALRKSGLLHEVGSNVILSHDVVCSTIASSLGEPLRRSFHAALGRASTPHISLAARARHFGMAGLSREASAFALEAAQEAAFRFSLTERIELLHLAHQMSEGPKRRQIAEEYAAACLEAGQYNRAVEILDVENPSPSISLKRDLAALKSQTLRNFPDIAVVESHLDSLLERAAGGFPNEFIELARQKMRFGHEAGSSQMVTSAIAGLVEFARRTPHPRFAARALCIAAYQAAFYEPLAGVNQWLDHARQIGVDLSDKQLLVQAELGRAMWAGINGRTTDSHKAALTALRLARESGFLSDELRARLVLMCVDIDRLRYRRAVRQALVVKGRSDPSDHAEMPMVARLNSTIALLELGEFSRARDESLEALQLEKTHPYWLVRVNAYALYGSACLELGRLREANDAEKVLLGEAGDLAAWMDDPTPAVRFLTSLYTKRGQIGEAALLAARIADGCRNRNPIGYWGATALHAKLAKRGGLAVDTHELERIRSEAASVGNLLVVTRIDEALAGR